MKTSDLMHRPVVSCHIGDNLNRAAQLMWQHDCGALPVLDDDGELVGMITDRDACMAAYLTGQRLADLPVSHAMATDVVTAQGEDPIEAVAHAMAERQLHRVPVMDGAAGPVGIVSLNDIARYATSARKKDGLEHEVTETLAAISRPRAEDNTNERSKTARKRARQTAPL